MTTYLNEFWGTAEEGNASPGQLVINDVPVIKQELRSGFRFCWVRLEKEAKLLGETMRGIVNGGPYNGMPLGGYVKDHDGTYKVWCKIL